MSKPVKAAIVLAVAAAAVIAVIAVIMSGQNRDADYKKALDLYKEGDLDGAYVLFCGLDGYEDSAEYAEKIFTETKIESVRFAEEGDIITFGRYEQDNDLSNGPEEIKWLILERRGESVLVLSVYALDSMVFDSPGGSNSWTDSSVRRWLNRSFLLFAFYGPEQKRIEETLLYENGTPYEETDGIFLLSVEEVNRYFKENADRTCEATDYAAASGAHTDESKVYDKYGHTVEAPPRCHWWLRSAGKTASTVVSIYSNGMINADGNMIDDAYRAVRPAMWIDLSSGE